MNIELSMLDIGGNNEGFFYIKKSQSSHKKNISHPRILPIKGVIIKQLPPSSHLRIRAILALKNL